MAGEGGFPKVGVHICSEQRGRDRFPLREDVQRPLVALYRNNLTALSQRQNLFFVACANTVWVFKPHYPSQTLDRCPELSVKLPPPEHNSSSYIDSLRPHSINQLLVGDLGNTEILLCACDDGCVIAYTVGKITRNIQTHERCKDCKIRHCCDLDPFFHQNVGASAWGLALHTEGRLIAVSANTHRISVFAFALQNSSASGYNTPEDGDVKDTLAALAANLSGTDWVEHKDFATTLDRSHSNQIIVLNGHSTNIPNIAFFQSPQYRQGDFLVSTDIDGFVTLWSVWTNTIAAKYPLYATSYSVSPDRNPTQARGWNVLCLDPLSFKLCDSELEVFGSEPMAYSGGFDITDREIPVTSVYTAPLDFDMDFDIDLMADVLSPQSTIPQGLKNRIIERLEQLPVPPDSELAEFIETLSKVPVHPWQTPAGRTADFEKHLKQLQQRGLDPLPILIFHISEGDVRLIYDIFDSQTNGVIHERVIGKETSPDLYGHLQQLDRLNMVAQIPELGVVIVASQVGRAAILTMTKLRGKKLLHGFRVECRVPFESQEKAGRRPRCFLLGIATAPLQGHETNAAGNDERSPSPERLRSGIRGSRKYRLFLTYCDHTVLTYEIARPDNMDGQVMVF